MGEIPVFNRRKAPVRGEAWSRGQPASVQLLLSEAAFLALSSGSEWPGGGQSSPLLPWGRKSNNVQGPGVGEQHGPVEAALKGTLLEADVMTSSGKDRG